MSRVMASRLTKKFHCDIPGCSTSFGRQQEFDRHKDEVHGRAKICPWCFEEFKRWSRLFYHIVNSHRPRTYKLKGILIKFIKKMETSINTVVGYEAKICAADGTSQNDGSWGVSEDSDQKPTLTTSVSNHSFVRPVETPVKPQSTIPSKPPSLDSGDNYGSYLSYSSCSPLKAFTARVEDDHHAPLGALEDSLTYVPTTVPSMPQNAWFHVPPCNAMQVISNQHPRNSLQRAQEALGASISISTSTNPTTTGRQFQSPQVHGTYLNQTYIPVHTSSQRRSLQPTSSNSPYTQTSVYGQPLTYLPGDPAVSTALQHYLISPHSENQSLLNTYGTENIFEDYWV